MHPFLRGVAAVTAAGVGAVAWGSLVERNWFALRSVTAPVLPPGAAPLRIVQVSDLHLVPRQQRKIAWVRRLAELEPDLVVNTGDNFAALDAVPAILRAYEPLLERPGVFVMGSNDYWAPTLRNPAAYLTKHYAQHRADRPLLPVEDLIRELTAAGWTDLNNARTQLRVGREHLPLELVGVDDPHIHRDDYATVAGPANPAAALTVGVMHAPYQRVLDAMAADGAGLLIAGHTHGGQLAIPGFGAIVTNCDLDRRRAKGMSRWWVGAGQGEGRALPSSAAPAEAAYLQVSAGLGTSPFAPVRFACRPEATVLTLTAQN